MSKHKHRTLFFKVETDSCEVFDEAEMLKPNCFVLVKCIGVLIDRSHSSGLIRGKTW